MSDLGREAERLHGHALRWNTPCPRVILNEFHRAFRKINKDRERVGLPLLEDRQMSLEHRVGSMRFLLAGPVDASVLDTVAAQLIAARMALWLAEELDVTAGDPE